MPAPPAKADILPAGSLSPADYKTEFEKFFDYAVALLGASGNAADALTALGAAADAAAVKLTGNQTVAGVKTFSSSPIVPTPTTNFQACTKAYADTVATTLVNAAVSPATLAPTLLVAGTPVATTSGTTVGITGIPSWAKRVTLMFDGVSTNGTSPIEVQLGDSGGYETTGYLSQAAGATNAGVQGASTSTTGFVLSTVQAAAATWAGSVTLSLLDAATNTWVEQGVLCRKDTPTVYYQAGVKSLSGVLDRIRLNTISGVDSFDAGTLNVLWE